MHDEDTLARRIEEAGRLAPRKPALSAFRRAWHYEAFLVRSDRMAAALAHLEVGARRPLGLLLPPVPTAAMAMLAGFRLGAAVVPCDPMQEDRALLQCLHEIGDGVLVTLDLTRLQQRWEHLLDDTALAAVLVEKMSEMLPFPRNLLMPLLRGGEIASLPEDPRIAALPPLLRTAALELNEAAVPAPRLLRAGGPGADEGELLAAIDALLTLAGGAQRWMLAHHLDDAWALAGLMAPLTAGRHMVVLPRLDRWTVANALAHERPQVTLLSAKVADALAEEPPAEGVLDLVVVPPQTSQETRSALTAAAGCRVAVWPLENVEAAGRR